MLTIKEISIKNFRSIVDLTIKTKNLNIFVGLNDAGKSNILKALNLFFNDCTDDNRIFDFQLDYSKIAPDKKKKAKEIIIQIKLEIPNSYVDSGIITWKKVWRKDGLISEGYDREFSSYSKTPLLLKRINYKYIPAVKSSDYFTNLLGELYSSLTLNPNNDFSFITENYTSSIQEYTKRIGEIIEERLAIESKLTLPKNQINIFKLLTFNTKDLLDNDILLEQRGDGIKTRHIPAILKYIAEQNNIYFTKGSVPYTTIWGYEEPETGIEMSKCFEVADEFIQYSNDIQIFTTTHSPAFYALKKHKNLTTSYVLKNKTTKATELQQKIADIDIHEQIGIVPIVTPFIEKIDQELSKYKKLIDEGIFIDMPTLCVEGKSDKISLEYIIKQLSPSLTQMLSNREFRIITSEDSGGTVNLQKWAQAWAYSGFKNKLYLLFDKDNAGIKAKTSVDQFKQEYNKNMKIKAQYIKPSSNIIEILSRMRNKNNFLYEIEHLYSSDLWQLFKDNGWLERRSTKELHEIYYDEMEFIESISDALIRTVDPKFRDLYASCNVADSKKMKLFETAKMEYERTSNAEIFDGFVPTIKDIENYFYK